LVLIWAFVGILIRQTSDFSGRYPAVIAAAAVSLAVFIAAGLLVLRRRKTSTAP
jgi:hypothetical protein